MVSELRASSGVSLGARVLSSEYRVDAEGYTANQFSARTANADINFKETQGCNFGGCKPITGLISEALRDATEAAFNNTFNKTGNSSLIKALLLLVS